MHLGWNSVSQLYWDAQHSGISILIQIFLLYLIMFKNKTFHKGFPKFDADNDDDDDDDIEDADVHDTDPP